MPIAGLNTRLKISGTAVPVVNEATSSLGGGVYQVTTTSRRIWDPSAAITIKDGGVSVGSTFWTFDYLFGKVTFSGYSPSGAITVDGSYLPVAAIAEGRSVQVTCSRELADVSTWDGAGWVQRKPLLKDAEGSCEFLTLPLEDVDPVAGGSQTLAAIMEAGTPKLLEITLGAEYLRAWVLFSGIETSAEVAGIVTTSASFSSASQAAGASVGLGS